VDPYYVLALYGIAFIIIWVLALLFKDKLKLDVTGPLIMRRTTRLRDFINSIAQISPRFWRGSMTIGISVAVFFMVLTFVLLVYSLGTIIQNMFIIHGASTQAAGVYPIIPGVPIPGSPFNPPLGAGLVAIAIVIVFHEFAHGILSRAEGIKIKSIGLLLLAILPGAFVEPDEEGVKKASRLAKLRIYAAGSISNIVVGAVVLLILTVLASFFINPYFHASGVEIQNIVSKSPSDGVLQNGMLITHINSYATTNRTSFTNTLSNVKPGDVITVTTNQGTFKIKTTPNPNNSSRAYIGVSISELGVTTNNHLTVNQDVSNKYGNILPGLLYNLYILLFWIFFYNIGIGTFNLLPLKPLDGGLMFEELLNCVTSSDLANKLTNTVSVISVALVVSSLSLAIIPAALHLIP
jgi:membrane-associated protease RseP (regulator of RpoE activity)